MKLLSFIRGEPDAKPRVGAWLDGDIVDLEATARFAPDGGLSLRTTTTLAHLDLSEPANGPIRSVLHLPAPLNAVLFALRDEEGAIRIPLKT